ncbi:hypothetical protein MMC25_004171 [Agyrium rufum]|nr:hypothetical protein [Agyrium rufum]
MITTLIPLLAVGTNSDIHALISDVKRFIMYSRSTIEQAPLQLYSSAIIFVLNKSLVRGIFERSTPVWLRIKPEVQSDWDNLLQALAKPVKRVIAIAFSSSGKWLASVLSDGTVSVWDVGNGTVANVLKHPNKIEGAVFSVKEDLIASLSEHQVRIWDVDTGTTLHTIDDSFSISAIAISPASDRLAFALSNHTIKLWDIDANSLLWTFSALTTLDAAMDVMAFSPNGKVLASRLNDFSIRQWNVEDFGEAPIFIESPHRLYGNFVFSPDGRILGSISALIVHYGISLRDTRTGILLRTFDTPDSTLLAMAFSHDGKTIVTVAAYIDVILWDVEVGIAL